jgi:hypothetical protein
MRFHMTLHRHKDFKRNLGSRPKSRFDDADRGRTVDTVLGVLGIDGYVDQLRVAVTHWDRASDSRLGCLGGRHASGGQTGWEVKSLQHAIGIRLIAPSALL